ncbi:MAG TPA: ATP-binding protein, partial [Anaerolineales bacterium]
MAPTLQVLIYLVSGTTESIDQSSLVSAGYELASLSQAEEVETWLNTWSVDTLLIIVHPSATEGLKRATKIVEAHPTLPIILVSHKASQDLIKKALALGIFDHLTTPVQPDSLLEAVRHCQWRLDHWQERNRYTHVLANLVDGFILAKMDGHLLMVNRTARHIFQLDDEPAEGRQVSEVFSHPDLLDIFKTHNIFPNRREISLENGQVYSAQASLIPDTGIAVILQEITHLKELDRIKTDFVNTVSHDIRSPLTAIYGFVGLIDRVGQINEQQAEFIHHIQASVQHITSLINDLMDLGRVEAGYDLQMEDVNMGMIIQQSIGNLDYQMNEKMQELVVSIPGEMPVILGNALHLQRMVTNLIENAVKFTPVMGKITVRCRAEANQVILEVSDSGPGIPLVDQPHIFEKFYRGSNLSLSTPGTG